MPVLKLKNKYHIKIYYLAKLVLRFVAPLSQLLAAVTIIKTKSHLKKKFTIKREKSDYQVHLFVREGVFYIALTLSFNLYQY